MRRVFIVFILFLAVLAVQAHDLGHGHGGLLGPKHACTFCQVQSHHPGIVAEIEPLFILGENDELSLAPQLVLSLCHTEKLPFSRAPPIQPS